MFLLDTNVVSELMRTSPDPAVEAWVAGHPVKDLFFSAVGESELRYGAAIMPAGRRRETLVSDIEAMLHAAFENRILPFDSGAARAYAEIAAKRRFAGRAVAPADCQIAAIARSPRYGSGDAQHSRLRGHGDRCIRPMGRCMSGTTEALFLRQDRRPTEGCRLESHGQCEYPLRGEYPLRARATGWHTVRLRALQPVQAAHGGT